VKKLKDPWHTPPQALRSYRELKLLRYMQDCWRELCESLGTGAGELADSPQHENVVAMLDCFISPNSLDPTQMDLYIVQENAGTDIHNLMRKMQLGPDNVKFFMYQLLRALVFLHSAGIIHRDLKPSNIASNDDSDLKVLDFGMARLTNPKGPDMTGYVTTRYYRAPEIITFWEKYTGGINMGAVDMWSVGCILAELLSGGQVLFPGNDTANQLNLICRLIGAPPAEYTARIEAKSVREFLMSPQIAMQTRTSLKDHAFVHNGATYPYFNGVDTGPEGPIDLLEKLLVFDPDERMTAQQAIEHPWFADFHDPSDEPKATQPFDNSFEALELDCTGWFAKCCEEIALFRQNYVQS